MGDSKKEFGRQGLYSIDPDSQNITTSVKLVACGVMVFAITGFVLIIFVTLFITSLLPALAGYFWSLLWLLLSVFTFTLIGWAGIPVGTKMIIGGQEMMQSVVQVYVLRARFIQDVMEQDLHKFTEANEIRTRMIPFNHGKDTSFLGEGSPAKDETFHFTGSLSMVTDRQGKNIIEENEFVEFLQGAIDGGKGFDRNTWIPKANGYTRTEYDGMMDFLVDWGIIVDRKDGVTGSCVVDSAAEVCERLQFKWD